MDNLLIEADAMDSEDAKKLIVNVKGVDQEAWEMARAMASRHDESLGTVVSRALRQLHNVDAGPREIVPSASAKISRETANPAPMTEDQRTARMQAVAAMMQGLAAVKTATGRASGRDIMMQEIWALDRRPPRPSAPRPALMHEPEDASHE